MPRLTVVLCLVGIFSGEALAQRPAALRGSPERLALQNKLADSLGLSVMANSVVIMDLAEAGELSRVEQTGTGFFLDPNMARDYPYPDRLRFVLPEVEQFLKQEAAAFTRQFPGARLKVTSLVRTVYRQRQLAGYNENAATCTNGDMLTCSLHLRGAAVDVSKKGLNREQLRWLRDRLLTLQNCGWIVATEELYQNHFHVFVRPDNFNNGWCPALP